MAPLLTYSDPNGSRSPSPGDTEAANVVPSKPPEPEPEPEHKRVSCDGGHTLKAARYALVGHVDNTHSTSSCSSVYLCVVCMYEGTSPRK